MIVYIQCARAIITLVTFDLSCAIKMASTEKSKRRWGKTRNREKITVVDQMEIEVTLQKFAEEVKSFKERHEEALTSKQDRELDLLQPELMSDFSLVEELNKIKVPIPVYAGGRPSRERLLYLFRQHVIPRPQRQGRRLVRRRDRKLKRVGGQCESSASANIEVAGPVAMEVDAINDFWALDSDGSWVLPSSEKTVLMHIQWNLSITALRIKDTSIIRTPSTVPNVK